MRPRIPALVAVAVLAVACIEPLPVPDGRYGAITAGTFDAGPGVYTMKPEAAFYGKTDLSYQPFTNDTCLIATYTPGATIISGLTFLNAGEFLQTTVSGRVDSLRPVAAGSSSIRIYQSDLTQGIPFTPGDTLSVIVPGAQFPSGAISVRTAEAFTHGTIGVPSEGEDLPLTWTAAPIPGSQMTFSLRYANIISTTGLNEQIYCSFIDDGSATIPGDYLSGWVNALMDQRQTRAARIRSLEIDIDTRTRMSVVSSFAQPMTSATPPATLREW